MDRLRSCFDDSTINDILNVPFSGLEGKDEQIWGRESLGLFSVKSAYHLALESRDIPSTSSSFELKSFWARIWHAYIPPKVKHFVWRIVSNSVPVAVLLSQRHIISSPLCPLCKNSPETVMHALLECSRARKAWKASDFAHFYLQNNHLDIIQFLSNVFSSLDKGSADLLMCFMWTIWNQRNNVFFNRFALHPKDMFAWCQSFLLQYLDAGQTRFIPSSQGDQSPSDMDRCPPGRYKVFTDAAIDTGKQVFSLSVVVKNDSDQVIVGLVKPITGIITPVIAEAKVVSLAMAWTKMINLPVHVLFSDCKVVVDKINI
ncbi:uncharacterized protein LOC133033601 [Cannabis sativa]|uniref:uncharacterized protein LOC133033601 n=1 Tax=Cannabis sativa TaxID=3483 RepID=UPI0029CA1DF5|nr:uncharacterized protein LOC133033601 [Cannabis sativa]